MCDAYPTKPKRVRRTRVVMEMTPSSATVLREHAAKHGVMIRVAALDMAHMLENRETLLFETSDTLKATQDKLAASEEARQLAEKVAFDHAEALWKAQEEVFRLSDQNCQTIEKWAARCADLEAMTAWDHVRAAVGKSGLGGRFVAAMIGLSLFGNALQTINIVWGML